MCARVTGTITGKIIEVWTVEKPIMKDVLFLQQPSEPATEADKSLILDLQDTLNAHRDHCVGMAANMIGVKKRMIVVAMGFMPVVMINPEILSMSGEYEAEEGCLSLTGTRKTTRYRDIEVKYQDPMFKWQRQKFSGPIAQAIQHECDHLEGIII